MIIGFDTKGEITLDDIIETLHDRKESAHNVVCGTRYLPQSAEFQGQKARL